MRRRNLAIVRQRRHLVVKAPVAAADTRLPVPEDVQREAEARVEDRPHGIHTGLGNAGVSCRELSGRKIRKTLGSSACTVCRVVKLRELAARFIRKRNEWIPSQAQVERQAARHLEVIFHVQAVEIPDQVVVQCGDLRKRTGRAIEEIYKIVAGVSPSERKGSVRVEVLIQDALLT